MIRRHLKDCPHTSTRYRRCRCPIHVYGTLGGHTIRRALDQTSWDAATETINGWTALGEVGVVKAEARAIREAIAKCLADCEARHLGWEAKRKYRHLLEDRLLGWCDSRGLSNLRHLTVDALRQFRQSWKDSPLYATKNLERLRAFLRFCQQAGWIKQNPATSVKPPKVTQNDRSVPAGMLADVELHFAGGELDGLKLIGFAVWSRRDGGGKNITFPARQFTVHGERRHYSLLRSVEDAQAEKRLKDVLLQAYLAYEAGNAEGATA